MMRRYIPSAPKTVFDLMAAGTGALFLTACAASSDAPSKADGAVVSDSAFTEVFDVIPFEDRNRRKFDSPVVGDLDGDGRNDLIINEHGMGMFVFWNDGKTFSKGPKIVNGDVHGAAVSDFNGNGKVDIIVTQGGGDGGNPKRPLWVEVSPSRKVTKGKPFDYFEPGRGRAANFIPRAKTGELDLLVTGFPMPSQKQGANHFYQNNGDGTFKFMANMPQAKWLGYRPVMTDFNSDGINDVIYYGGKDMVAVQGKSDGTFTEVTDTVLGDLRNLSDVSTITEIDFDNDGDFDLFLTRAEHQFDIESYYNEDERRFAFLSFRKDYLFEDILVDGNLNVENLQRTYPHRDVFLGAKKTPMKFDGDPHGHQDAVIKVEDALGWPEGETAGGLYIGYIGDGYWRIGGQSRSRTAASFANVDAAPKSLPQPDLPARLYENRNGQFVDVTTAMGLDISDQTTGAASADYNNDGWPDLVAIRYGSMAVRNAHVLYLNQGGTGFSKVEKHGLQSTEVGATGSFAESFDYDDDGAVDLVYSNERGKWHLMKNTMPDARKNNYLVVNIGSGPAGAPALGAVAEVKACGETRIRKVGATSAAFSQSYNTRMHFGLGSCDRVDSVVVTWANGQSTDLGASGVNFTVAAPQ